MKTLHISLGVLAVMAPSWALSQAGGFAGYGFTECLVYPYVKENGVVLQDEPHLFFDQTSTIADSPFFGAGFEFDTVPAWWTDTWTLRTFDPQFISTMLRFTDSRSAFRAKLGYSSTPPAQSGVVCGKMDFQLLTDAYISLTYNDAAPCDRRGAMNAKMVPEQRWRLTGIRDIVFDVTYDEEYFSAQDDFGSYLEFEGDLFYTSNSSEWYSVESGYETQVTVQEPTVNLTSKAWVYDSQTGMTSSQNANAGIDTTLSNLLLVAGSRITIPVDDPGFVGNVPELVRFDLFDSEWDLVSSGFLVRSLDCDVYQLTTSVSNGTYHLMLGTPKCLVKKLTFTITGNSATTPTYYVIRGDIDGDNEVGPGDSGLLNGFYGRAESDDIHWLEFPISATSYASAHAAYMADLDRDGEVGPGDAGLLSTNFGLSGDEEGP